MDCIPNRAQRVRIAYAASSGTTPLPSMRSRSTRATSSREASPSATRRKAGSSSGALSRAPRQPDRSDGPGGKSGRPPGVLRPSCEVGDDPLRLVLPLTVGVDHCIACAGSGVPPAPKLWFGPPFSPSVALGVDQFAATRPRRPFSGTFARLPVSFQSREVGVGQFDTASSRLLRPLLIRAAANSGDGKPLRSSPSFADGVGQAFAAIASGVPMPLPLMPFALISCRRAKNVSGCSPSLLTAASIVGHSEDKQPFSLVARANLCRRKQSRLNPETQSL